MFRADFLRDTSKFVEVEPYLPYSGDNIFSCHFWLSLTLRENSSVNKCQKSHRVKQREAFP